MKYLFLLIPLIWLCCHSKPPVHHDPVPQQYVDNLDIQVPTTYGESFPKTRTRTTYSTKSEAPIEWKFSSYFILTSGDTLEGEWVDGKHFEGTNQHNELINIDLSQGPIRMINLTTGKTDVFW